MGCWRWGTDGQTTACVSHGAVDARQHPASRVVLLLLLLVAAAAASLNHLDVLRSIVLYTHHHTNQQPQEQKAKKAARQAKREPVLHYPRSPYAVGHQMHEVGSFTSASSGQHMGSPGYYSPVHAAGAMQETRWHGCAGGPGSAGGRVWCILTTACASVHAECFLFWFCCT